MVIKVQKGSMMKRITLVLKLTYSSVRWSDFPGLSMYYLYDIRQVTYTSSLVYLSENGNNSAIEKNE